MGHEIRAKTEKCHIYSTYIMFQQERSLVSVEEYWASFQEELWLTSEVVTLNFLTTPGIGEQLVWDTLTEVHAALTGPSIFTDYGRSTSEGNVFSHVCPFVHNREYPLHWCWAHRNKAPRKDWSGRRVHCQPLSGRRLCIPAAKVRWGSRLFMAMLTMKN